MGRLHRGLRQALERTRQIVFVAGAAGLEKTTLAIASLRELGGYGKLWVGHGECGSLAELLEPRRTAADSEIGGSRGQRGVDSGEPLAVTGPGVAISLSVLGFNLFGDGLRGALDPRLK